jgi:hypothetical protein
MSFDAHANFAYSAVAVAPSPPGSGLTLTVTTGDGAIFPAVPFNVTVWPAGVQPLVSNATILRVTNVTGDVLTFLRVQEGSADRTILVGDQITASITNKTLTDIETVASSGSAGPMGPQGLPGSDGQDGGDQFIVIQGEKGATGSAGANGADGAPGVGIPGADGQDGGDQFIVIQGATGAAGPAGADGAPGVGIPGNDGADGGDQFIVIQGQAGTNGTNGTNGVDGAPGVGIPGNDGQDGGDQFIVIQGQAGAAGANGANGADGSPGTPGRDGEDGADYFVQLPTGDVFRPSGGTHMQGLVPDPGATGGTTKFLREDATWQVPPGGGGSATITQATITCPYPAKLSHRVTVTDGTVTGTSKLMLTLAGVAETQANSSDTVDMLDLKAVPAAGSFEVQASFLSPFAGALVLNYLVG